MTTEEWKKLTGVSGLIANKQEQAEVVRRVQETGYKLADLYQDAQMRSFYVDTHRDVTFGGGDIQLHSHSFYEFICIQCASGVEYMLGTECVSIQKGDVLIIPPNIPHCPLIPKDMSAPYDRDVLWISPELIQVMFRQLENPFELKGKPLRLRTLGSQWAHLPKMFRNGIQESEECRPQWEIYVLGNTLMLMAELRRFWENDIPPAHAAKEPQLLERAIFYIDAHYSEKITLGDIAKHCMVSESTICHAFRNKMNISFSHCLLQRRLLASKELILTDKPLEEVGKAVGFSDYSTFYRAFKREYGISPRQFKELSQGELFKKGSN